MSLTILAILVVLFLLTSAIGVVTGSNSLVTVPIMFQFGIDEKEAVATNMFGLTFMAVGATIPFVRAGKIDLPRVSPLIVITLVASALGAALVGVITNQGIRLIVSFGMIAVVLFTLFYREKGIGEGANVTRNAVVLTYLLTFFLGIYGGLYSGGYVTVMTAVYVAFFSMTYGESIAATKLINVFSSGIATLVFMWQGLVDYRLGLILGAAMFAGAYVGAHFVTRMNDIWLRRIFLSTVLLLAAKTLYDLIK
jgi:uncharacterized membrane protein YfcA